MLLGRRDGSASGHGLWGLPGGRVESGEGLPEAAARERHEEMGLDVDPSSLSMPGVRRYGVDGVQGEDFVFLARHASGTPLPCTRPRRSRGSRRATGRRTPCRGSCPC
ncbi:NUDIX hydrolase [Deinococcus sp.]|uniref:NUDIX hydrolase n=1 Tax=Deinococcus sp. TaxID=47478 RepID=UPI002869E4D9|nr:NUDIX hydrolase [Deinococcus sp.]